MATAAKRGQGTSRGATVRPKAPPPLILVVDDYADGREMLVELLTDAGYRVDQAGTGKGALDLARRRRPDLLLLDLALPDIDGWEVARRLKKSRTTASIPIVALTAHTFDVHAKSARAVGCDAFVTKPCEIGALLERIASMISSAGGARR